MEARRLPSQPEDDKPHRAEHDRAVMAARDQVAFERTQEAILLAVCAFDAALTVALIARASFLLLVFPAVFAPVALLAFRWRPWRTPAPVTGRAGGISRALVVAGRFLIYPALFVVVMVASGTSVDARFDEGLTAARGAAMVLSVLFGAGNLWAVDRAWRWRPWGPGARSCSAASFPRVPSGS
jgi:hypothetical protein